VRVPSDPDSEIYLEEPGPPMYDEATVEQLRELITKGAVGWIAFQADDTRALYETLKARRIRDRGLQDADAIVADGLGKQRCREHPVILAMPAHWAPSPLMSRYLAVTCQQPANGNSTPTSIAVPKSAIALVPPLTPNVPPPPSSRTPLTVMAGDDSAEGLQSALHQNSLLP
jgi:hypothetical protein